jgi:ATP-dependent DNA ligase
MTTSKKEKRARSATTPVSIRQRATPAFVTPMAAQVVKRLPEGDDWIYELKFDGYRALIIKDKQRVELRSRKNKDLTGMYRGIAAASLRLNADQTVVDEASMTVGTARRGVTPARNCVGRHDCQRYDGATLLQYGAWP